MGKLCSDCLLQKNEEYKQGFVHPRTVMRSEYDRSPKEGNFGFAFNDSSFSERVLRIEVMAGPSDSKSDADGCCSLFNWARHRKRRREDLKKDVLIDNHNIDGVMTFWVVFDLVEMKLGELECLLIYKPIA